MPQNGTPGFILAGISYLAAPSIGLFFMISGAVILKPCNGEFNVRNFLEKRLSKVIWPTLFWFFCGKLLDYFGFRKDELGILWFMYSLIGLYLLSPILIRWISVASKREIEFYLLLWGVSLCYPLIKLYFNFREDVASWVYYFHGYVGYFILGYYLNRFGISKKLRQLLFFPFVLFSVMLPTLNLCFEWNLSLIPIFWYRSISIALFCIFLWDVFSVISRYFLGYSLYISALSRLTFGIYLVHIIIMRNILWQTTWMQQLRGGVQILVCSLLTFLLSYFLCLQIDKMKFSKYLIGV